MKEHSNKLPFEVPKDYFLNLADHIMEGVKASRSLSEDTSVLIQDMQQSPTFEVPKDYFENLSVAITQSVHAEADATYYLQQNVGVNNPHILPASYFDQLSDTIISKISQGEEDLVDTSFIEDFKQINVFAVPEGYFENLKPSIAEGVTTAKKEVQTMVLPKRNVKWTNWAAAACVLFIFTLGGIWMMGTDVQNSGGSASHNPALLASLTLAEVSDEDIEKYIENDQESFDIYSLMDNASASTKDKKSGTKHISTENLLENISQEEIDAYLEAEGI